MQSDRCFFFAGVRMGLHGRLHSSRDSSAAKITLVVPLPFLHPLPRVSGLSVASVIAFAIASGCITSVAGLTGN